MIKRTLTTLALTVLCCASSAFAWSAKEHILITRTAVRELLADSATPSDMKQWLRDAQPGLGTVDDEKQFLLTAKIGIYPHGVDGLAFWAVYPDLVADSYSGRQNKVAPYNVIEQQLHFVDVEYLNADEANRTFAPDLSHKPKLADIPHDMKDPRWAKAGMLPFRLEDCYSHLVQQLKQNRLVDKPGQFPHDEHATKWAGMLAHYAADNTMPLHATVDYQANSFFPNVEKKPKVHFDMEYILVDDDNKDYAELRQQFWQDLVTALPATKAPEFDHDVWTTSLELSLSSYDALPMIGHAAQAAYFDPQGNLKPFNANAFYCYRGQYHSQDLTILQLKAQQQALAVKWIEFLYLRAWQEAHDTATASVK